MNQSQASDSPSLVCHLAEGSRLVVIGLGGIGCIVLEYLAIFLRGRMLPLRLVLIDGDTFEVRNSERMAFEELGNKAEVKAADAARCSTTARWK